MSNFSINNLRLNEDIGFTRDDLIKKTHEKIKLGDRVEINSEGEDVIATVVRFYPFIVSFQKDNGIYFSEDYLAASQARVIKRADDNADKMQWGAILDALADEK